MSALNHPNILTIHDIGAENGVAYLVTELLHGETVRALALQEIKSHYANLGMTAVSSTPEQFSAYVQDEIARWAKVVKAAGIKAD